MILTLRAVSLNDQPLTRPITARFDGGGGTIGRADHSTLALPDPERFISRKQAEIVFVNDGFLIRNVGAANPIHLTGRTLAGGESAPLADGDDVRIGGYLLRAEFKTDADRAAPEPVTLSRLLRTAAPAPAQAAAMPAPLAARPVPPPAVPQAVPPAVPPTPPPRPLAPPSASAGNPFADLLGDGENLLAAPATDPTPAPASFAWTAAPVAADPFADLLGSPPPASASSTPTPAPRSGSAFDDLLPPAAGLSARSAAVAPPPPPSARLPDDFDPFGIAAPAPMPRPSAAVDPFADLAPVAPPTNIDQQFDLLGTGVGAGSSDPLKDFEFGLGASSDNAMPASAGGVPAADPMAMFDLLPPATAMRSGGLPMQDNLPGVNAAFEAPRMAPYGPPPIPPDFQPMSAPEPVLRSMPAAPPLPAAFDAALWQAFCEGAGLHLPMPADPAQAAERMRQVGLVLRAAVAGTRELMAVRASTKYEMRASVTQIQARSNNPLKFAPDVKTGVEQLVQPATRGFLDGPAAMEDAMSDLVGHSIGSVAGMRAALEGLLDRFDPASLESTLGGSMLDHLLPLNRRSRLWELYLQRYRAIREEAQEDFHALFGTAFVAAYEQQVARLKRAEPGEPRQSP